MEDFTNDFLQASSPPRNHNHATVDDSSDSDPTERSTGRQTGLRGRVAALREKANVQDRLLEKRFIPSEDVFSDYDGGTSAADAFERRPNFNITTMSNNFRRFNSRIGVVFRFQVDALRVLSWRRPSHTLSLLAVYSFVCLDPYLLAALPLAALLVGVFVPYFLARHPAPASDANNTVGYSPRGPPLAPALTIRPAKELSRDFFRNIRDLQNSMEDISSAHDAVATIIVPVANFSDEALSSVLFNFAVAVCAVLCVAASLLPWRLIFLVGGWAAVLSGHPAIAHMLAVAHERHVGPSGGQAARLWIDRWITRDVILDSAPETREVEVFELQRASASGSGEWQPWLFSPSPYDPLSQGRTSGERPRGTRFFEDVLAPDGWEWSEKKWALDLWSREWVEERIITSVEVETEGERWVYDMSRTEDASGGSDVGSGLGPGSVSGSSLAPSKRTSASLPSGPSWEEGGDDIGVGRRGEWRRRRWVRIVKRKVAGTA